MPEMQKIGFTVRPRSLNPGKAIVMAICPIIMRIDTVLYYLCYLDLENIGVSRCTLFVVFFVYMCVCVYNEI